ncbi:hypothetical protein B0A48_17488 [Cryoendolithus antarcticus]|uniref:Amino acid permease/ SLC12A domain-containing protein n=1 Tax=Cryoendolithus antarcticus TaxID=1507870 RepID=A0A1V8SBC5_9PEZI|nr:hypothetical protein B0A48_17488 [Cryoendolithus antarcticus]
MVFFSHSRNPSSKETTEATYDGDSNSDSPPVKGHHDVASTNKRQIGVISASFLIFNRMIGTGIFATLSDILAQSGSVGLALFIWVAGMILAAAGMAVYLEFGTALPRNGGEKKYRLPEAEILDNGSNLLGVIKLIIILIIVVAGWAALGGALKIEKPHNFDNAFEGTTGSSYGVVTALYNVIWSYIGYSNANYALSETKDPVKTLKIAGPLALGTVAVLYMCVNIAYFAAVPKEEILTSGRILAAAFFRNVFGERAERALSVFVALSAFGNVLSVIFSQGRLVQELGREGILPFSRSWASSRLFNAPLTGLFEHWLVSVIIMLAPPPGDAHNLILNVISYPLAIVNAFVALGLIWLYTHRTAYNWDPPFRATLPVVVFFFLSNVYLVIAPFIPPDDGQSIYESLPYWLHCVIAPKIGKYELVREATVDEVDGWERHYFVRRSLGAVAAEY